VRIEKTLRRGCYTWGRFGYLIQKSGVY